MRTNNIYQQGSEWRKWDLHIHTPASYFWSGSKSLNKMTHEELTESMNAFIDSVNNNDIAVYCIMDYWTFDWYIKLKEYLTRNTGLLKKTIFPGMELRVESPTDYRLNIHVILSDKLNLQELIDFKSELYIRSINKKLSDDSLIAFAKSLDKSKAAKHGYKDPSGLTDEELLELGSKTAEITNESLQNAFKQIPQESGYIILPYDTSDGLLNLKWDRHPQADNYFMQSAHIFESRDSRNIDLFCGKRTKQNTSFFDNFFLTLGNKAKPCISGSDAHRFSDYGTFPEDKITWIKADPTFEGLKQIIYEPTERVSIQPNNPDLNFDKALFTKIEIKSNMNLFSDTSSLLKFRKNKLLLNRNMVSIIGGRGQGKSMLINFLAHGLNKEIPHNLKIKLNLNDDFSVSWKQNSEAREREYNLGIQNNLPYTFIHQSKIKDIADDNIKLKNEVNQILIESGLQITVYEKNDIEILQTLQNYWNILKWFDRLDSNDLRINDKIIILKKISDLKDKINLITEGSNQDLLELFVKNVGELNNYNEQNYKLRSLRTNIINYSNDINEFISGFEGITAVDVKKQLLEINSLFKSNLKMIYKLKNENSTIKESNFKEYKGDLSQLLSNLTVYQMEITELEEHLKEIEKNVLELKKTKEKLNDIVKEQSKILFKEVKNINDTWQSRIFDNPERGENENKIIKKILDDRNIKIEGLIFFNESAFYIEAEKYIDGRALKPKSKQKVFDLLELDKNNLLQSIFDYTIEKIERIKESNPSCFYEEPENDIFKIFLDPTIKNRYIQVLPNITVNSKNLNELSAGQKGTVYFCLKLATQLFSGPIIFDQPEDDLDNEFITNELIELFKEIKKYRQVIIVSHNANLVVNADSDQIIIATNSDEELNYFSGSLENELINEELCKILEGGKLAFEKRRNKYIF